MFPPWKVGDQPHGYIDTGESCLVFFSSRNKMVEYLTDWVMGTSNQAADDDVKCLTR